jgi:nucleoside-diphosphate-sugar epimerase
LSPRVLITGGAGFFGQLLVHELLEAGLEVRSLDVLPLEDGELRGAVDHRLGDVRDPEAVGQAVQGCEVVVHNAALVPVTRARRDFFTVNVDGTRVVLDAARREGVRHAVHISSSAVYGTSSELPITEDTPAAPVEAYGRSKAEADRVARAVATEGLPLTIMRPRTLVGPGRLGLFELVFDWIRTGRPVFILGRGDNRYQLLASADFARACLLAVQRAPGGEFNIGSAEYTTPRQDLQAVIDHAGSRSRIRSVPPALARAVLHPLYLLRLSPLVPWHYLSQHHPFYFDTTRARERLGFVAAVSNREMLIEAYDGQRAHQGATGSAHRRPLRRGVLRVLRGKR